MGAERQAKKQSMRKKEPRLRGKFSPRAAQEDPRVCGERQNLSLKMLTFNGSPLRVQGEGREKKCSRESQDSREIWRRSRDLNPGDGIPSYSLSRGAKNP